MMDVVRVIVLLVLCGEVSAQTTVAPPNRKVTVPPLILQEPPQDIAFREGESLEMPCVASGEPTPLYSWQWNEQPFDPSGTDGRIATQPGSGTLIFANPIKRDEALYQCFATNDDGVALTVKVNLRWAYLDPFPSSAVDYHRPYLGTALTLRCIPPRSYPKPSVFWATIQQGETFTPIDLTDRVTIDPEGNLHFVNILPEDERGGRRYACIVQNQVMRSIQQGEYATISPQGQHIQNMPPKILWASPTQQRALRGETWRIKCIFSGSPTPRVDWERQGDSMPANARTESFGQELVVENLDFGDTGNYECQGINDEAQVPIRRSFQLLIESKPYWTERPESVDAAEGDDSVFHCNAHAVPEATFYWFLNGVPVSKVPEDSDRIVEKNRLTFRNMSKDDAQVVQCNATNKHGYIFANAYLNVLTEPPIILEPPLIGQRAAEGQTINLICHVFGSPKPLVTWLKGTEQLTGGRYRVLEEGHLEITDVSLVDSGTYVCRADNKHGSVSAMGSLVVRRKTQIQTAPLDVMVYEGTEAKFTCTGTTDPEEVQHLEINWKKDGEIIDYQLAQRVFKNDMDNSLTISGTISLDTGKYTCVAENGLDEDEASAQLIVQGPPDPPNNVIVRCTDTENKAEIEWQPGKENYAPILNYIIQFNTTFTPDTWIDIMSNVSQNVRRLEVTLSPWGNYTFRVLARNKIGLSYPSEHTKTVCRTQPAEPSQNPENVIAEGDLPNNLVVFWTPMPKIEQNGEGFKYIITYRRTDITNAPIESHTVEMQDAWHQVFPVSVPSYTPYEVSVKASNSQGDSTVTPAKVQGFSGEDVPNVAPENVLVLEDSITATTAQLQWLQVDESPDVIHGFFRGYRLQFGKEEEWPENIREQDAIFYEPPYYPRPRIKRQTLRQTVTVTLRNLPPNSKVVVQVRVLNKYYAGPPSIPINFQTLEGQPGPPALFDVSSRGPTHFDLTWEPPYESNGVLVGYNISYQTITGLNLGRLQYRTPINDPDANGAKLTGLMPDTYYRVYLSAATQKGSGEHIFLDMKSTKAEPPSPPTFTFVGRNNTFVNITWEPSRSDNPGSVFYVQYRARGGYHWLRSPDEYVDNFMEIYNLDPGTVYQVRVVSRNGEKMESPAPWQEFRTDGVAPGRYDLKSSAWFYGIFLSMFLIIILIVLFVFFKRVTDGWWLSKEDEIADQVKQLQAEEAVRQMGLFNPYAETGSRELGPHGMSYGTEDYKADGTYDEEGSYSDGEEEEEVNDPSYGFSKDGQPVGGGVPPGGYIASAGYHPAAGGAYAADSGAGYPQAHGYQPPQMNYEALPPDYNGVSYRGGRGTPEESQRGEGLSLQDPNRSRSSAADTFV